MFFFYNIKNNLIKYFYSLIFLYPAPSNLSYIWNFGVYAILALTIQLITGILLAVHYIPYIDYAFVSVEHIMRDVNNGWLLRYIHANGASIFFIAVYVHICRNIYYGSYLFPRSSLWNIGVIIFILMIITAFMGYVLPWGQMSFWAATVITNLFSAIPYVGPDLVIWLWSGYSVSGATLTKFFSLHYLLPFVILLFVIIHIYLLHLNGSNNPVGINLIKLDSVSFFPYYSSKDIFGIIFYILLSVNLVLLFPNLLGHSDNYIVANPMITPSHIVPEWYLLPFYAILRSIPNKLLGVVGMGLALIILMFIPLLFTSNLRVTNFKPISKLLFWFFVLILIELGVIGGKTAENPYILFGQILTTIYFSYFVFIQPAINFLEYTLVKKVTYYNLTFLSFINVDMLDLYFFFKKKKKPVKKTEEEEEDDANREFVASIFGTALLVYWLFLILQELAYPTPPETPEQEKKRLDRARREIELNNLECDELEEATCEEDIHRIMKKQIQRRKMLAEVDKERWGK